MKTLAYAMLLLAGLLLSTPIQARENLPVLARGSLLKSAPIRFMTRARFRSAQT